MSEKNSSLEKALAVLDLFQGRPRLTMTEAAQATGFSNAAVSRILNTLESRHYIYQDRIDGGYYLTDKLFVLGRNTHLQNEIVNVIEEPIAALCRNTGLSVSVSIRKDTRNITVLRRDPQSGLALVANVGDSLSLNCTACGKVLTAFSQDYRELVDRIHFVQLTRKTIVDHDEFLTLMEEVRRQKLAYDMEEVTEGLVCVAAPVLARDGIAICAISVSGYKERMLRDLSASLIPKLQDTAAFCEKLLQ